MQLVRLSAVYVRALTTAVLLFICAVCAIAQTPFANSDPTYLQLRNLKLGNEALLTENVEFKRDFATFTFRNGTIFFAVPVNGKITGAVFVGQGTLVLNPQSAAEKKSLSMLSKSATFEEQFEVAVLRFTDNTYEQLKSECGPQRDPNRERADKALAEHLETVREDRVARYNISARILQDLLAAKPGGGFFAAQIKGKKYSDKELFIIDPQGVTSLGIQPEEVAFSTYDTEKLGLWAASHLQSEYGTGAAKGTQINAPLDLISVKLDAELRKSSEMQVSATTTFAALRDGMRVAPFSLFRNFTVESVTDASGQPLPFIMEKRPYNRVDPDDPDNFSVILPKPLAKGEKFTFQMKYGGKEAISNEGGGNYFPIARDNWYPSARLGDYAEYEIAFRIPKGMKIAATGTLLSEKTEGDWNITEWKTEVPITFAGFNFGKFKVDEQKTKSGFVIQACANSEQPSWVNTIQRATDGTAGLGEGVGDMALGNMNTTSMMAKPMAEAQGAMGLYSEYFGPISYKRLAVTQQTAPNYGQAWPGLVWLPILTFYDPQVRHQLGADDRRDPYWSVVTPHEVAHEWWGHTVGWASYRDQWMSEGFAQLSASIFAQAFYSKADKGLYHRIWEAQQKLLLEKNQFGYRAVDVGPLSMGYRVNSSKSGNSIYNILIYSKGSYVLHMLRMMMWDENTGDKRFKEMMRDFVTSYKNQPASTEDFKAVVERHMTPAMNLDGNSKMDWFFNQWIYGTEIPKYDFTYNVSGDTITFKLTQSNVSPQFKMLVPVYFELPNGKIRNLGSATLKGNTTIEQKIPIGKGDPTPKRMMINYNYDVLTQ